MLIRWSSNLVPFRIFKKSLHDELRATCSEDMFIPELSPPPLANAASGTNGPSSSFTEHDAERAGSSKRKQSLKWPWSAKKKPRNQTGLSPPPARTYQSGEYFDAWEPSLIPTFNLPVVLARSESLLACPPRLSPFPYPEPDPPVVIKHELGDICKSVVVLEVSCSRLKAPDDSPNVVCVIKCITTPPARVSSVAVSFSVEGNQIMEISPEECLGKETRTESSTKSNNVSGLHASMAVKGVSIGAQFGKEKGVERTATEVTQMSIKGILIGTREARWVLTEDPKNTGGSGLPRQTELAMRMRFKPRMVACSYTIAATKADASTTVFSQERELTL
jgi:hypothetical protein